MGSDREMRRRRVLALTSGALATLAGCPADGGSETETSSTTAAATDTATASPTETETPSPAETPSPNAFADDFGGDGLGRYRAVDGSLDPWSVTEKIDGSSALVDTTDASVASLIAPATDALTWPGTGTVRVDVQFGTGPAFKNCKLVVGDLPGGSSTVVQLTPQQVLVSAPDGTIGQQFPEVGVQGVHHVEMVLGDGTVAVTVDDEHEVRVDVGDRLPAGTVGFGIEADRATAGGKTWFDNLDVSGET